MTDQDWTGPYKADPNHVFSAEDIQDAISETLPPCENCQSELVLAARLKDALHAVTKCLICHHLRKLTEAEYLREWPSKELS